MTYRPPQVRTVRQDGRVTAVAVGLAIRLAFVGKTLGRQDFVSAYEITNTGATDTITDSLEILGVSQVRSAEVGGAVWVQNVDYVFTSPNIVDWAALTVIPAPYIMTITPAETGGTLTANTYYYVVTAQRTTNLTGPVVGDTTQSNEVSATIVGATGQITLTWNPVPGAESYKIFRTVTQGVYTSTLLETVVGEFTATYVDKGLFSPGAGTPPGANTAYKKPAVGDDYYVDYVRRAFSYFTPTLYTRLSDIIADHGLGSPIAKAATLAMGTSGRGNAALYAWVEGLPDVNLSTFQTAFDLLMDKDLELLIPITDDFDVLLSALAHVELASDNDHKKERRVVGGPKIGALVGDPTTSGTMVYEATTLANNRAIYVAPWAFGFVQQTDGQTIEEELDGCYVASAVAGLMASQPDRATSITHKRVQGISQLGKPGGRELDNPTRDYMASYGVCVVAPQEGSSDVFIVRDSITTSVTSLEDRDTVIGMVEDFLRQNLRRTFSPTIGAKNLPSIRSRIEQITINVLANFLKLGLISNYDPQSVSATVDPTSPDRVIVYFSYTPVYTIREIEFRYAFDLRLSEAA